MPLESFLDGTISRSIAVFTDISHLKLHQGSTLSMIGAGGEPSFYDIISTTDFKPERAQLTDRELEILFFIARGMNTGEIANRLSLSDSTVSNHRKSILKKTGCKSSAEVVAKAYEL